MPFTHSFTRRARNTVRILSLFVLAGTVATFEARAQADEPNAVQPTEIPIVGRNTGLIQTPSAPDAWGGARTGAEPTLSDRVADYSLRAVLDPVKHTIKGTGTLRWRNRSALPIRTLYFHTYLNAFEGSGSTFMTEMERYGGFRSGVKLEKGEWGFIDVLSIEQGGKPSTMRYVQPDGGPPTDRTVLRVDLAEAVAPGAIVELTLAFHDQLPRVLARTGYFANYHLVGQWYPKIGVLELAGERGASGPRWNCHELHLNSEFYADWGSYELEVIAPKEFTVAASGQRQAEPTLTPEGLSHRFRVDDVHDVVFTAWDGYAPALTGATDVHGGGRTEVTVLFAPENKASGEATLEATLDSIRFFSKMLGPYPYPHVTVILPPYNAGESSGMEYETFYTSEASDRFPRLVRYVTIHEFGHGYFMGLLASNEFEEPFLDEGLDEYWGARMVNEDPVSPPSVWERWLGIRLPPIDMFHVGRMPDAVKFAPDALAQSSWQRLSARSFASVYGRTVTVFHGLQQELGTPLFDKAMRLYYQRWHFRHPSAADLKVAFLDAGAPYAVIERFFNQQVWGAEAIDDAIVTLETTELVPRPGFVLDDGKRVELDEETIAKRIKECRASWDKQHDDKDAEREGAPGPYPWKSTVDTVRRGAWVPQTLEVRFEDDTVERLSWPPDEKWHHWEFVRTAKIKSATLDPDHNILMDQNKFDDARAREPDSRAATRWTLELNALIETVIALASSL